ncbi:hypothetical protein [Roseococcus sp.]|uniref:hypothetical protein n=1 Tax=Roseococcus sp. TaxID=2109646 RepID=UPI003BA8AA67
MKWTLETKDPAEVRDIWPATLAKWAAMQAEWHRLANAVSVTPERADEIAATWLDWARRDAAFDMGGEDSDLFSPGPEDATQPAEKLARIRSRVEHHTAEALRIAGVSV